ncbi:hypothetical protein [Nonomuraea sp. JJY05]
MRWPTLWLRSESEEAIVMDRISREDLLALLEPGAVQLVEGLPA